MATALARMGFMGDTRTRALERRWRETGAPEDQAAFLLECVRAGALPRGRLELAAFCGNPAARLAVAQASSLSDPATLARVAAQLSPVEKVRLAAALGRHFLPLFEGARPDDDGPRRSLDAAEAWCVAPNSVSVDFLREAGWAAGSSSDDVVLTADPPLHDIAELAQGVADMAQCAATDYEDGVGAGLAEVVRRAALAASETAGSQKVIAPEFSTWVLGLGDPVAARLQARPSP